MPLAISRVKFRMGHFVAGGRLHFIHLLWWHPIWGGRGGPANLVCRIEPDALCGYALPQLCRPGCSESEQAPCGRRHLTPTKYHPGLL